MNKPQDFWSRRKVAVQDEIDADTHAEELRVKQILAKEQAEKPDEELLEELGLPNPDTLKAGDDFRAFMTKAVPDRLRRRALRRLWLSNPALANLDGLIDYGEDFTDSATVIENLQTAYQVGKGMMAHVEEMARNASEDDEPDEESIVQSDTTASESAPAEELPEGAEDPVLEQTDLSLRGQDTAHVEISDDFTPLASQRRMHFVFESQIGRAHV